MDNRKLSILKSDQCKMLVLTIPGVGGEVIAHYGPVTDSPKEMAEVVRRYNAFPELVKYVNRIARLKATDEAEEGEDLENDESMDQLIEAARELEMDLNTLDQ